MPPEAIGTCEQHIHARAPLSKKKLEEKDDRSWLRQTIRAIILLGGGHSSIVSPGRVLQSEDNRPKAWILIDSQLDAEGHGRKWYISIRRRGCPLDVREWRQGLVHLDDHLDILSHRRYGRRFCGSSRVESNIDLKSIDLREILSRAVVQVMTRKEARLGEKNGP